jgi:hypothetical protein
MMISPSLLRGFKTIRKPGKGGPAAVAFLDPGPPLRDFSKKICSENKILCVDKPTSGSRTEDLAKPISSEPAPSHRPWIGTLGATPERRALPYHAGYEFNASRASFFPRLEVGSCGINPREVKQRKQQLNCRMRVPRLITGNAVGRPSWPLSFLGHPSAQLFAKNEPLGKKLRKASGKTVFGQHAIY